MDRYIQVNKAAQVPIQIRQIAMNNILVHRVMDEFVYGRIVTLEEMLCQMVIGLSSDWAMQRDEYLRVLEMATRTVIIPEPKA